MLEVQGLTATIGTIEIIRGASLAVAEGQMCGLIGVNGAGKTTFMRALMGAVSARGRATFAGVMNWPSSSFRTEFRRPLASRRT